MITNSKLYYSNQQIDKLYQSYYAILFSFGFKFCGRKALVNDSIQEVFLTLCENPKLIKTIESPESYLKVSVKRRIIEKIKEQKKSVQLPGAHDNFIITPSYERLLIDLQTTQEKKARIESALNVISDQEKKVLILRFYNGLSYDDIAERLGSAKQTVYNQIHSAIKKLQKEKI